MPENEKVIQESEQTADAAHTEQPSDADASTQAPERELTVEEQLEKARDEHLRLMAELRNVRQRGQREKQEALKFADAEFGRELLVVMDDFERTLESGKDAPDAATVLEGVRIVYDHFCKVLQQRKIQPIEALGKPFDPELHQAMLQQPSDEHTAGIVMQEIARGYRLHDRVIRPSKVIVSSGPAPEATGDAD